MRRAFFFPHSLLPGRRPGGSPGRVPFDIHGPLVSRSARRDGSATVFADGYEKNTVGSNQDPCIFSSPLGPFHAFCRINGKRRDLYVRERDQRHSRLLSHIVSTDDIIIYGKFTPPAKEGHTTSVWVDTVIVVDEVVSVKTGPRRSPQVCNGRGHCKTKRFTLTPPWAHQTGPLSAIAPGSDGYIYCLSDAAQSGLHCCTQLGDYRIIVGRSEANVEALVELRTSFVPLARTNPVTITSADCDIATWARLCEFLDSRVRPQGAGPHGGWIAEFPDFPLAAALCNAVIGAAGEVAIPPLQPAQPAGRWDPMRGGRA